MNIYLWKWILEQFLNKKSSKSQRIFFSIWLNIFFINLDPHLPPVFGQGHRVLLFYDLLYWFWLFSDGIGHVHWYLSDVSLWQKDFSQGTCVFYPSVRYTSPFRSSDLFVFVFQYFSFEPVNEKLQIKVKRTYQLLMVAAALVRSSFFLQELGQPAKYSVLSSGGLRDKVLSVFKEETEIGFVLFQRPIS